MSEEEAEEDIILSTSKISSSHEVNNYTSFKLKDENNITFVHTLLEAPKLIGGISTSVLWHVNKNCSILVDLNSLKSRQDLLSIVGVGLYQKLTYCRQKIKMDHSEKEILKKNFV